MTFIYIKNGNYNGISSEIVESYGICGIEGISSIITKVVVTIFIMLIKQFQKMYVRKIFHSKVPASAMLVLITALVNCKRKSKAIN